MLSKHRATNSLASFLAVKGVFVRKGVDVVNKFQSRVRNRRIKLCEQF